MLNGKTILITGGTGSWGHELTTQIIDKYNAKEIRIYSRNEHRQVEMQREFNNNPKLKFIIGDVRDPISLSKAMDNVDVVFHLAALKHVPICEDNGWEAVQTNVYGTHNIIELSVQHGVKYVIDISTDKAVDPFNLYGVTKACAEKLIVNANFNYNTKTKFVCIRGGNVLGTNGSVLPLFKKQIETNGEITITDPKMTRYLMRTQQAVALIFTALKVAKGGEVFVMRMPATTVQIMADTCIKIYGKGRKIKSKTIGIRPGEKMDEVLISKNESPYTKILNDKYFVILPNSRHSDLQKVYSKLKPFKMPEFSSANAVQLTGADLFKAINAENW